MRKQDETNLFHLIMVYVSESISPVMPALIGIGITNVMLSLITLAGFSEENVIYIICNAFTEIGFTFLPVFIAFAAARKLHANEYMAVAISLALIMCSDQWNEFSVFGWAIPGAGYIHSIIPILLTIPFMALIDRECVRLIPAAFHFTVRPLIVFTVTTGIAFLIFGPVTALIGTAAVKGCLWLADNVRLPAMTVMSGLQSVMAVFGTNELLFSVAENEIAEAGTTFLLDCVLAANSAMIGAALAVGAKAKKKENKNIGYSSAFIALLGAPEPALYGCLFRLRRPLISASIAATVSGLFLSAFKVRAYASANPCLFSMPIYLGNNNSMNFYLACVGAIIGVQLGFVITYFVGFNED